MITHDNFVNAMYGMASALDILDSNEKPRLLNYMPLAHMFGCGSVVSMAYLGTIGDEIYDDKIQCFLHF